MNTAAQPRNEHVTDHFRTAEDFDAVIAYARRGASTEDQSTFVNDIGERVRKYGRTSFLSTRQADYLRSLAKAAGYDPDFD